MIVDSILQKGGYDGDEWESRAVRNPISSTKGEEVLEPEVMRKKRKKGEEKKRRLYLNGRIPSIIAIRLIRLYLTPVQISSQSSATCSEFTSIRRYLPRA